MKSSPCGPFRDGRGFCRACSARRRSMGNHHLFLTGHALNQPTVPFPRWQALIFTVLMIIGSLTTTPFKKKGLSRTDQVACIGLLACFVVAFTAIGLSIEHLEGPIGIAILAFLGPTPELEMYRQEKPERPERAPASLTDTFESANAESPSELWTERCRAPGRCALGGDKGCRPFPRTPFSASSILPPLRFGQVSLDEAEHFLHNRGASVATLRWCSGSSRNAVRLPPGISVRLRRNRRISYSPEKEKCRSCLRKCLLVESEERRGTFSGDLRLQSFETREGLIVCRVAEVAFSVFQTLVLLKRLPSHV